MTDIEQIEQYRAGFEAMARQRGLNTARTKQGDRYRWHVTGVAWEFWLIAKRESGSGSGTSTSQGAAAAGFAKVLTEEQIIAAWDAQWRYHGHEPCKVGHVEFGRTVEVMVATRCREEGGNTCNGPVGIIVGDDPVHGWHMKALKPWGEIGEGTLLYAAQGDALDAARYKAEQRSMIIGQAVAHHRCEWPEPLWTGVMFFNGERITKAEFDERSAIAASTTQEKK